jgi:hypothetical protein
VVGFELEVTGNLIKRSFESDVKYAAVVFVANMNMHIRSRDPTHSTNSSVSFA